MLFQLHEMLRFSQHERRTEQKAQAQQIDQIVHRIPVLFAFKYSDSEIHMYTCTHIQKTHLNGSLKAKS